VKGQPVRQTEDEEKPMEALPDVDRASILAAIHFFDEKLRIHLEWNGWEHSRSYAYAIRHSGKLYPARQIISLATETSSSDLKNEEGICDYLRNRGFVLIPLSSCSAVPTPGEKPTTPRPNLVRTLSTQEFEDVFVWVRPGHSLKRLNELDSARFLYLQNAVLEEAERRKG
jgi:hypothetical protein